MPPEQLLKLWIQYREAKRPELAPTTYHRSYGEIQKRIERLDQAIASGREYRAALLATYSAETARRTLVQVNACCKWAIEEELIAVNPFLGVRIRVPKLPPSIPDAFTAEEMRSIINAFSIDSPFYVPWTQALFWMGARPEELRALRWEHLSSDGTQIKIHEAWPIDAKAPQATKTRRNTRFPLNPRLRALFAGLKSGRPRRTDWIFRSEKGQAFNYANYQRRHWRPIVERLVKDGEVSYYGSQYHARHTAITLMLRSGMEIEEVAYLVRSSRKVIHEHYLGLAREIEVSEY